MNSSGKQIPFFKKGGILALFFLTLAASYTAAVDYYVSPSGNNAGNGSANSPWQTIQYAADLLRAGDTLYIKAGSYGEDLVFRPSGTEENPIRVEAFDQYMVVVEGSMEFARGVSFVNVTRLTVRDFSCWGIFFRGENSYISLEGMEVVGGDSGIHFTYGYSGQPPLEGGVSFITVKDTKVRGALYTGIDGTPGPCTNMKFINLEVSECGLSLGANYGADGIAIEKGADILVEDCFIHDNGGDGIDLNSRDYSGNVSGVVVRRNRVVRNHLNGIKLWSGGVMQNNLVWGQGNIPVAIGDHPGIYVLKNNTVAYNMWDPAFSSRNYAMLAGYPNDDTGISAEIDLTLINNIFAFNTGPQVGTPTGIYLGSGVTLVEEGNNLFWSREDGEIQAEFAPGKSWFSRSDIVAGNWRQLTGQGRDDICIDPNFVSGWPEADLHLSSQSPAVDKGRGEGAPVVDLECMFRPAGAGPDMGAYERDSYLDPDCGAQLKKIIKKSPVRR